MNMSEQQNNSPRQAAVNALISWAKTGWGYYSMRDAVDNYLELCGANPPPSVAKIPSSHTEK